MSAAVLERCVVLHVPKCGGTWMLAALRAQGIVRATINAPSGATHPTVAEVRSVTSLPIISTVRDPVEWLRSFWRFFHARAWRDSDPPHPQFGPLLSMQASDFATFAARYLHRRPGYITEMLGTYLDGAGVVCRQVLLAEDLEAALELYDQPHVAGALADYPRLNVSREFDAPCPPEIEYAIRDADSWLVEHA
jgi:hypothetical protein